MRTRTRTIITALTIAIVCSFAVGQVNAKIKPDRFYLPQSNQPFEGEVDTRIGELEFDNQYPTKESVETLLDNMDFHGATQAYLWGIPIASFANLQYYTDNVFKVRQGELIKTATLKQKLGILTANATTPYIIATVNLDETGPFVIDIPEGAIGGMVDDFWQRPVTDLGLAGPDKGKGAKYLITPPGYSGDKPKGYTTFESPTNNIFIGIRLLDADLKKADALQSKVKTYAYKNRANPPKNLFPAPSAKYFWGPPRGMAFWERLHEILNREVVAERDRFFMAMLKRVGIEKGKPFNPTPHQKKLLEEAAFVGEAMAKANDLAKRFDEPYWPGASWKSLGIKPDQRMPNYDQFDERASWMYEAVTTSAGMVTTTPGVGSIYLASYADKDGDWLEGGKSYTLHVPANPPAEQFWSIAVYSWDTRTLIDNKQKKSALSSRQKELVKNKDGSVDLYFGPKAPKGKENNWVQTIGGQGWWVYLRFYAPTKAYFDKSWAIGDFEKVKY